MIDLHTHSVYSDGSEQPSRVVELAAEHGCSALALTDHDTLGGIAEATTRAAEVGIELVRGCEVSCDFEDRTLHVLCYFVPDDSPLSTELERLREDRGRRNLLMVERLVSLGLPITYEEVFEKAGGTGIGRPHFAAVLVDHGVVSDANEAFDRYLGRGRPGYVKKSRVLIGEVIDLARRSGALTSVAHPWSLGLERHDLDAQLATWAEVGLVGCESYYSRYSGELRGELVKISRRHGLVPTGGSDFHGTYRPGVEVGRGIGDLAVPDEALEELRARRPDS